MNAPDLKTQAPNLPNDAINAVATVMPYYRAAAIALRINSPDVTVVAMALAAVIVAKVVPVLEQVSDGILNLDAGKRETDEAIRCVGDSCDAVGERIDQLRTTLDAHLEVFQRQGVLIEQKKEGRA